jgi:hypothetical protein
LRQIPSSKSFARGSLQRYITPTLSALYIKLKRRKIYLNLNLTKRLDVLNRLLFLRLNQHIQMKKTVILACATLFFAATMTSCKKDYTCTCKIFGQTSTSEIKDAKKKDAESACDELQVKSRVADASATCGL